MRDLLTKDWAWKLFSLALAVVIWLVVNANANRADSAATEAAGGRDTVTFENLPVRLLSGGADVHDFKAQPLTVAVTVTGPHDVMLSLKERNVHTTVNVTNVASIQGSLQRVDVSAPPGVTLVSVNPPQVEVVAPPPKQ